MDVELGYRIKNIKKKKKTYNDASVESWRTFLTLIFIQGLVCFPFSIYERGGKGIYVTWYGLSILLPAVNQHASWLGFRKRHIYLYRLNIHIHNTYLYRLKWFLHRHFYCGNNRTMYFLSWSEWCFVIIFWKLSFLSLLQVKLLMFKRL